MSAPSGKRARTAPSTPLGIAAANLNAAREQLRKANAWSNANEQEKEDLHEALALLQAEVPEHGVHPAKVNMVAALRTMLRVLQQSEAIHAKGTVLVAAFEAAGSPEAKDFEQARSECLLMLERMAAWRELRQQQEKLEVLKLAYDLARRAVPDRPAASAEQSEMEEYKRKIEARKAAANDFKAGEQMVSDAEEAIRRLKELPSGAEPKRDLRGALDKLRMSRSDSEGAGMRAAGTRDARRRRWIGHYIIGSDLTLFA